MSIFTESVSDTLTHLTLEIASYPLALELDNPEFIMVNQIIMISKRLDIANLLKMK